MIDLMIIVGLTWLLVKWLKVSRPVNKDYREGHHWDAATGLWVKNGGSNDVLR